MIEVKFVGRGSIHARTFSFRRSRQRILEKGWKQCAENANARRKPTSRKIDMKRLGTMLALALVLMPAVAVAQNDAHHEGGAASAPSPPTASSMPQQCAPMMQMMEGMMGAQMSACMAAMPPASQAYGRAMMGMHGPMMEAMRASDPNVAFVKGMIPHHQAAIDMARAALQLGTDQQVRGWAEAIIAAQQAEIDELRAWLREHGE